MINLKWNKSSGFTLVEVILLATLIAISIATAISLQKKKAEDINVQKTAITAQEWLKAAVAYHGNETTWPTYDEDAEIAGTQQILVSAGYMPEEATVSPWGTPYRWSKTDDNLFQFAIGVDPTVIESDSEARRLLERVAAFLPSSEFDETESNRLLYTYTSIPSGIDANSWRILGVEWVDLQHESEPKAKVLTSFECPAYQQKAFCVTTLNTHMRANQLSSNNAFFHIVSFGHDVELLTLTTTADNKFVCSVTPPEEQKALRIDHNLTDDTWSVNTRDDNPEPENYTDVYSTSPWSTKFMVIYGCCPDNEVSSLCKVPAVAP